MELHFEVIRVTPAVEVAVKDEEGRFLDVIAFTCNSHPVGDPSGEGRTIGERIDLSFPDFEKEARKKYDPGKLPFYQEPQPEGIEPAC
jgi:hypothetical protein